MSFFLFIVIFCYINIIITLTRQRYENKIDNDDDKCQTKKFISYPESKMILVSNEDPTLISNETMKKYDKIYFFDPKSKSFPFYGKEATKFALSSYGWVNGWTYILILRDGIDYIEKLDVNELFNHILCQKSKLLEFYHQWYPKCPRIPYLECNVFVIRLDCDQNRICKENNNGLKKDDKCNHYKKCQKGQCQPYIELILYENGEYIWQSQYNDNNHYNLSLAVGYGFSTCLFHNKMLFL